MTEPGAPDAVSGRRSDVRSWHVLVPVVCAVAGLLFAAGAVSAGADPRAGSRTDLVDLITAQERQVRVKEAQVTRLRHSVEQRSRAAGGSAGAAQREADLLARRAGLDPVSGEGVTVTLDDSPRDANDPALPPGTRPDDLVVHQQDIQGVVNALWAGGARAVTVMDQRLIGTSAVRCAGNVLYLHGRTYAPPFVVRAVGNPETLEAALETEPSVRVFRDYVTRVGLGYRQSTGRLDLPGFDGPLGMGVASPAASASPTGTP